MPKLKSFFSFDVFPYLQYMFSYNIFVQRACCGADCYIKIATSYHQPIEYELVGQENGE